MTRRRALVALVALAAGVATAVACTAFDDVPAPGARGSSDDASTEGATDAAALDARFAPGLLSLGEAAQLCSIIARCDDLGAAITAALRIPVYEPSYSLCLTELSTSFEPKRPGKDATRQYLKEITAAPSCEAARAMLALEAVPAGDPRCTYDGGGPRAECLDPLTAITCEGPGLRGRIRHCGKPNHTAGETCVTFDGGVDCALAQGCADPACIGPILSTCRPSDKQRLFRTSTDCNMLGMQCFVGPDGNIGCSTDEVATRARSDGFLGAECDGTKRITASEFYFGETDCAALGGTCISGAVSATCAFPDDECSPFAATADTCAGTVFRGCVAGKKTSFDCASIGKSCVLASKGGFAVACE